MKRIIRNILFPKKILTEKEAIVLDEPTQDKSEITKVLINSYPKEVIEIHNAFMNESESLLNEAKDILNKNIIDVKIKDKGSLATELGFKLIKESEELEQHKTINRTNEQVLNAVTESSNYITTNKWIPKTSVERICKQWGLVFGDVSRYKGFLPNKNLLEIKEFKDKYYKKFECITKSYNYISYHRYVEYIFDKQSIESYQKKGLFSEGIGTYLNLINCFDELKICAPLKDMNTNQSIMVDGYQLVDIPDPIVLARRDFNGIEGYYIITAWGDEASDEEVINYKK